MNKKTHQPLDEDPDAFCRDLLKAAQASEQEVNAAVNAPFLYPQLLARIAAEQEPRTSAFAASEKQPRWKFNFFPVWQWRWALAATAMALVVLVGWYRLSSLPVPMPERLVAPTIAQQPYQPSVPTATATPLQPPSKQSSASQIAKSSRVAKPKFVASATMRRTRSVNPVENSEIATDYLPLTYVANGDERSGQVVRVEMPRSALLALGLPVNNESTGAVVKADVIVGDDGLALAIRFVR